MSHTLTTHGEAKALLEFYNYFHDGFIKSITITSLDTFESDKSQRCTGTFEIELLLAHYNYAQGTKPYDQTIKATFENVRDIWLDFRDITFDWAINTLDVALTERKDHQQGSEPCFALILRRNHLDDRNQWVLKEAQLFTFSKATFIEGANLI